MTYEPDVWKKSYQDDGFVIVRELIDSVTLSRLRECLDKVTGNLENLPPQLKGKIFLERDHVKNNPQWYAGVLTPEECGNAVRQVEDLALFDAVFAELICYAPMLDVLETLFGSSEFSFNSLVGRPKVARYGNGISKGNFHRDTPFEHFTLANTINVLLCLDEMTGENGATSFIRGSHSISGEEAKKSHWKEVEANRLNPSDRVAVHCPAGSGVFFDSKILHASGHNRSKETRRSLLVEWVGENVLPTSPTRFAYQGLKPRSKNPAYRRQTKMTFPKLFVDQG